MVTITTGQPTTFGERFLGLAGAAYARAAALFRAVQNRRSVAKLLDWDDRMLRDIGLTPGDVRAVMSLPVSDDPSYRLGVLSVERRAAFRAAAKERLLRAGMPPAPARRRTRIIET